MKTALYPNVRDDGLERSVAVMRAVRNAVRYESPRLREAYANRRRAYRKLLASLSAPAAAEPRSLELSTGDNGALEAALAELEGLVPPSGPLVRFIREQRLDAVVCIGRVNFGGGESDVAKAARAAGVPSALIVYSWDNLSSKALVHVQPDRVFVWNDFQVDEAVELHRIPRERRGRDGRSPVRQFFSLSPSAPPGELLGRSASTPGPTVLYLGSSGFVTKREPELSSAGSSVRRSGALGCARERAAPASPWHARRAGVARLEPGRTGGGDADTARRPQHLYDQLFVADAVVALNTSAELEAGIVGRPVLTVEVGDLAPGQEGSSHFRYLLAEAGGFVETARSLDEHVEQLNAALSGDPLAEQRGRFVERFVRPRGPDSSAGAALADEIEALATLADTTE